MFSRLLLVAIVGATVLGGAGRTFAQDDVDSLVAQARAALEKNDDEGADFGPPYKQPEDYNGFNYSGLSLQPNQQILNSSYNAIFRVSPQVFEAQDYF